MPYPLTRLIISLKLDCSKIYHAVVKDPMPMLRSGLINHMVI
jgi:hypothetical protein